MLGVGPSNPQVVQVPTVLCIMRELDRWGDGTCVWAELYEQGWDVGINREGSCWVGRDRAQASCGQSPAAGVDTGPPHHSGVVGGHGNLGKGWTGRLSMCRTCRLLGVAFSR